MRYLNITVGLLDHNHNIKIIFRMLYLNITAGLLNHNRYIKESYSCCTSVSMQAYWITTTLWK